jgi:hypothetical protein
MHDLPSAQEDAAPAALGVSVPIPYTAKEVGRTFTDLLETFDYAAELYDLGVGRLHFFKRAKLKKNLTAISIALWHIALEKSFPKDSDAFFAHFIATYPPISGTGKSARKLRDMVIQYDTLASEKKDTDFTLVADALVRVLNASQEENRWQQLKISLRIRAAYDLIFEKLI